MNIFYPNAGRQGVARQTEWRQKLPESGIFGGNAGNIYMSMGNFEGGVRALLCALGVRAAGRRGSARLGSSECYENNGSQKPLGTGRTSL